MFLDITRVLSKSVTLKRHCSRNVRVCSLNKPIDIKPIVQIKIQQLILRTKINLISKSIFVLSQSSPSTIDVFPSKIFFVLSQSSPSTIDVFPSKIFQSFSFATFLLLGIEQRFSYLQARFILANKASYKNLFRKVSKSLIRDHAGKGYDCAICFSIFKEC